MFEPVTLRGTSSVTDGEKVEQARRRELASADDRRVETHQPTYDTD